MSTDRIETKIQLNAPRSRVWRALADSEQFGQWFRCKLEGAFAEGATVRGRITHPGYEHLKMEITVDGLEKTKQGELVRARATNRVIEIEFEFHCVPDARANMRVSYWVSNWPVRSDRHFVTI